MSDDSDTEDDTSANLMEHLGNVREGRYAEANRRKRERGQPEIYGPRDPQTGPASEKYGRNKDD